MLPRTTWLFALALLSGCSSLPGTHAPAVNPTVTASDAVQNAQLASYISSLQTVVQGSPAEQAEVVAAARATYEQARQGPAALHYALLLAAPGYPGRDPQQAERLLREVLVHPELLSSFERALAVVEQARVQQELGLVAENARLVVDAQQERDRQRNAPATAVLAKRLQDEMNDNARLRKDLEDAKAKLEAIANIERNIPDRQPASEARKP
jgi:hypothetical protein